MQETINAPRNRSMAEVAFEDLVRLNTHLRYWAGTSSPGIPAGWVS